MKNKKRSLIALCCVVMMLAETILGVITPAEANAATTNTVPSGLKEITFSDFGIDDGTYTANGKAGTYPEASNLIDTVFSGTVSFDTEGKNTAGQDRDALLYIGGTNDSTSLLLRVGRKSIKLMCEAKNSAGVEYIPKASAYQFWNTEFDIETFVNYEFELKLSFECVNHDNDATANDLKLGMWVDETLCGGDYIYVEDYVGVMGTNLHILGGAEGYMAIPTVKSIVKETESTTFKELTFKDFSINNGTYTTNGVVGTYTEASNLIGTVFSGTVSFDTEGKNTAGQDRDALLYIGGTNDSTSLLLRVGRKSIQLLCEAKNSAGVEYIPKASAYQFWNTEFNIETFVNYEFELKLSFECVNHDNDATANDLKLGMWVDETLCGGDYIYVEDYVGVMGTNLHILGGAEGYMAIPTVTSTVKKEVFPIGLQEISFDDFSGFKEGTYTNGISTSGIYSKESLEGTSFVGNITFTRTGGDPCIIIGGKTAGYGLVLRTGTGTDGVEYLRLYSDPSDKNPIETKYFYSDIAGTQLIGQEFKLYMTFEVVNLDEEQINNDLKLGMWFNGTLYNNEYIYLSNFTDTEYSLGNYLYACGIGTGSVTLESTVGEVEEYPLIDNWNNNTTENIPNAEAKAYDIYYWGETNGFLYNEKAVESVSGTECYMTYTVDDFSGTENKYGLVGTTLPNEKYPFKLGCGLAYTGTHQGDINPLFEIGYTYFVTFKVTDKAYEYTVLRAKDEQKEILISQTGNVSTSSKIDFKHFGIYLEGKEVNAKLSNVRFWDQNGTDLNVVSNSSQTVIFDAGYKRETNESYNLKNGDYVITGTDPIIVTGDNIEIGKEYKSGDILDQEGTYKIVSSHGLYTKNVELYMGERKSQNISTQEDVMPIAGFYGPYRGTDKNGTYRDHVTDDVFKKIQKMGINLIVASPGVWSKDDSSDTITKSLLLAEKYGLGVYVTDYSLLKKSNVVNNFDFYSNFSSFKGIHIIDEPTTASYYGGNLAANTLTSYTNIARQLNQYTNLNGYINLLGLNKAWASSAGVDSTTYYETYLNEYIAAMGEEIPHHLSFCNYVFDTAPNVYFENLAVVRKKALELDIPFWAFVQAGTNFNDAGVDLDDTSAKNDTPSKGQFLWNVNTTLAYGAKGIQYFPLIQPSKFAYENSDDKYDYERNGLIAANGELTNWGEYVQHANDQIAVVDDILMNSTSVAVVASGRRLKEAGISKESYGNLKSIDDDWESIIDNKYGALVGVFEYRNKEAYYVVNDNESQSQDITLTFTGTHKYRRIDKGFTIYGEGNTLKLEDVPAGGAVLIVLDEVQENITVDLSSCLNGVYELPGDGILGNRDADGRRIEASYAEQPGIYHYNYVLNDETYCGKAVIYRAGDVNVDNITNICDLVRLKKGIDSNNEIVWNSAMKDVTGEKLRKLLVQK